MVLRPRAAFAVLALGVLATLGVPHAAVGQLPSRTDATRRDAAPSIRPGWLGLAFELATLPGRGTNPAAAATIRATVRQVFADGPAARAGLRTGDRLIAIDGRPIDERTLAPGTLRAGDTLRVEFERGSQRLTVDVRVDPIPAAPILVGQLARGGADLELLVLRVDSARQLLAERLAEFDTVRPRRTSTPQPTAVPDAIDDRRGTILVPWLTGEDRVAGARFLSMPPELARYFGVERGLLVESVAEGTPAAKAGLVPGDVLTHVGGEPVTDMATLRRRVASGRGTVLQIVRRGRTLEVRLPS